MVQIVSLCRLSAVPNPAHAYQKPELEMAGWLPRMPMENLIYFDHWGNNSQAHSSSLVNQIKKDVNFPEHSVQGQ